MEPKKENREQPRHALWRTPGSSISWSSLFCWILSSLSWMSMQGLQAELLLFGTWWLLTFGRVGCCQSDPESKPFCCKVWHSIGFVLDTTGIQWITVQYLLLTIAELYNKFIYVLSDAWQSEIALENHVCNFNHFTVYIETYIYNYIYLFDSKNGFCIAM